MIRKATPDDISAVAELYDKAIDHEESHVKYTSWQKGIYPTADTARLGLKNDSLYVYEEDGKILGSVILVTRQPPEYKNVTWNIDAKYDEALVIHTLCVDPDFAGTGIGSAIVDFAKELATESGKLCVRLNTTQRNIQASRLYQKNGFVIVDTQEILLNGQIRCGNHLFMEYVIRQGESR
jgi:ribosomal protein S18 acetylase RimI-like enzyme